MHDRQEARSSCLLPPTAAGLASPPGDGGPWVWPRGQSGLPPSRNTLGLWETVHSFPLIPHLL